MRVTKKDNAVYYMPQEDQGDCNNGCDLHACNKRIAREVFPEDY